MRAKLGNINLYVKNPEESSQFYTEVLGLIQDEARSYPPTFILLDAGDCTITLQDSSAPGAIFGQSSSIELGFAVEEVEPFRQRFQARGITASSVQQMGWGEGFDAVDLDGHRLTIYRMSAETD